jgi:hypothetical protein
METIFEYAQGLVYTLLSLMPSEYQQESLQAMLGLFLGAEGEAVPRHTQVKSASALSRFLNQYQWSTRAVLRATRQTIREQVSQHRVRGNLRLKVLLDLTTLPKRGKFKALQTQVDKDRVEPWVRVLKGKRGLHIVTLYLVIGEWRVPWSFRVWRGKGQPSPAQLGLKLLRSLPKSLTQGFEVIVLADAEFATKDLLRWVRQQKWRCALGIKSSRTLQDGRTLKSLYRHARRGLQVTLNDLDFPLTVSWFWLNREDGKRELRFVVSTYPYSGAYLVRLGRQRWAIEGFFKTIKHRFGWHRFGQKTRLGVYRWLILALIAFLLTHWVYCWVAPPALNWRDMAELALSLLFPFVVWVTFLRSLNHLRDIAVLFDFAISLKPRPIPY